MVKYNTKNPKKVKQGKKNRAAGARFEKKVREDLESKGWMVSKWQNNVEFKKWKEKDPTGYEHQVYDITGKEVIKGKCIPAKMGRFRTNQSGFPDFIAYQLVEDYEVFEEEYNIIFVESKSNGYLNPEEKEKARWYLDNNYCSKFLIAKKKKVGRKIEVEYVDFEEKYGKEK
ncbi:MAG: hypothetical protein ACOC5T_04195 [Elusimicrobiota bacterium]